MAMRRLLSTAGNRRSAPVAWMSSVEKVRAKVDLSPRVLTASPAGDQPSDLNKFFEISGEYALRFARFELLPWIALSQRRPVRQFDDPPHVIEACWELP